MSLYNELQERGYTAIIYPARYPYDETQRANYGTRLAKFIADKYDSDPEKYAGKPTDPLRFNEEDLQKRELSYRRAGFLLQFMLDTSLSDADKYPLRLRDLIVGTFSTDEAPMKLTWMPDPARKVSLQEIPKVMGLRVMPIIGAIQLPQRWRSIPIRWCVLIRLAGGVMRRDIVYYTILMVTST